MKPASARLLQLGVVLAGVGALAFLLGEPWLEGRNAHANAFQVYFQDPFLAYACVASIPFFVALSLAFGLLGHAARQGALPPAAAATLRSIKVCAIAIVGFVAVGEAVILLAESDDRAGGVFIGLLIASAAVAASAGAAVFERRLRRSAPDVAA